MSNWAKVGDETREKKMGSGGDKKRIKKYAQGETSLEPIIWFLSLGWGGGERVSGAWGQQTASFLPARERGDRKGHQRGSLGQRSTSCQGRQGSRDKYIQVAGRATCLILSPLMLTSMAARWGLDAGRGGWVQEPLGVKAWRDEVASFCVFPSQAGSPELKESIWVWSRGKETM